jgi:hypothetical protein
MRANEHAKENWIEMIKQSWTWGRLTQEERTKFLELLEHPCSAVVIKGTYNQRWEACEALYHTFLEGLGYKPLEWREQPSTKSTFFELNYKTYGQQVKPLQMTDQLQATRLTRAAKNDYRNKDVVLTKVEIITTPMEVK